MGWQVRFPAGRGALDLTPRFPADLSSRLLLLQQVPSSLKQHRRVTWMVLWSEVQSVSRAARTRASAGLRPSDGSGGLFQLPEAPAFLASRPFLHLRTRQPASASVATRSLCGSPSHLPPVGPLGWHRAHPGHPGPSAVLDRE